MTETLAHRGPNGRHYFQDERIAFGHARLSVIDTSTAGDQPMSVNGVTLVYNGELYNFQEKRKELEARGITFKGHSDAEVLLYLYLEYGKSFFQHLRGMYAFAIWDSRNKSLLCARDPLGIKPFLYAHNSKGFFFGSEIKSFINSGLINCIVNRQALRSLLERGSITQPMSILEDVRWLLPGHYLEIKDDQIKIEKFYTLKAEQEDYSKLSKDNVLKIAASKIQDSVERQMISDVPLGAFLSGGLDSSLLVALMSHTHHDVKTFSVGFEGHHDHYYDETSDAEEVAKFLKVHHTKVVIPKSDIKNNIRQIAKDLDHPSVDGVNSWYVSRAASTNLTVAISGTGGDELFGGYPWFHAMKAWENSDFKTKIKRTIKGETFEKVFASQYFIFDPATAGKLIKNSNILPDREDPLSRAHALNRVTGMLLSGYCRDQLLADIDTCSMGHSLEVRVPFLDERLLEFALALPDEYKISKSVKSGPAAGSYESLGTKAILMDIAAPLLPPGFCTRSKRGFTLPFDMWLKEDLKTLMDELLSEEVVNKRGFFNYQEVQHIKNLYQAGKIHYSKPWLLMMTELWAQEVLDA